MMAKKTKLRVAPHDKELERVVLGGILVAGIDALIKVQDLLAPSDFYVSAHQKIMQLLLDVQNKGQEIDIVTAEAAAREKGILDEIGGVTYLSGIVDTMPSSSNIRQYAQMVRDKAVSRKLMETALKIVEMGYEAEDSDEYISLAEKLLLEASERRKGASVPERTAQDIIRANLAVMERIATNGGEMPGLSTGLQDLDRMTTGLQPSDLIIIAGRPSTGKSTLAQNIAQHAALRCAVPVGIFSLEMSAEQIGNRMLSSESGTDHDKIRTASLARNDLERIGEAAARLYDAPLWIDDAGELSITELAARARRMKQRYGIGLIIVDYLQLAKGKSEKNNREQEVSSISRGLKALAKELDIPIIALSQLNRSAEYEKRRIRLSDLRESGSIEQDADVVMFLENDSEENEHQDIVKKELVVAKQRSGPTGAIVLTFVKSQLTFRCYSARGEDA